MRTFNLSDPYSGGEKSPTTGQVMRLLSSTEQKADPVPTGTHEVQPLRALNAETSAAQPNTSLISAIRERLRSRDMNATADVKTGSTMSGPGAQQSIYPALHRLRETGAAAEAAPALASPAAVSQPKIATNSTNEMNSSERTAATSVSTENQARLLLDELAGLESRCAELATRLGEIARDLQSGNTSGAEIGSDLLALRTDVAAFQKLTVELARSLSVPADAVSGSSATFDDLRSVLKLAADAHDRNVFRLRHAQAARELEDVLSLECAGTAGFNPLDECQSRARHLIAEIAAAQWPDSHPDCMALAERNHACSGLLDLVRQGDQLSDEEWERAEEAVATLFGRRLAVAAVRGRLRVKTDPSSSARTTKRCPACNADLEPGAKFCDECGVKLE